MHEDLTRPGYEKKLNNIVQEKIIIPSSINQNSIRKRHNIAWSQNQDKNAYYILQSSRFLFQSNSNILNIKLNKNQFKITAKNILILSPLLEILEIQLESLSSVFLTSQFFSFVFCLKRPGSWFLSWWCSLKLEPRKRQKSRNKLLYKVINKFRKVSQQSSSRHPRPWNRTAGAQYRTASYETEVGTSCTCRTRKWTKRALAELSSSGTTRSGIFSCRLGT